MKKFMIFFIGASLLTVNNCFGQSKQSAYFDAVFIKASCYDAKDNLLTNENNLLSVFSKYYPNLTQANLLSDLKSNPFFKNMTPDGFQQFQPLSTYADRSIAAVGGLDVTNISSGIADLLINRAKQELTIAFFNRFQNFVNNPDHPEFKTLFPQTTNKLDSLVTYNYATMMPQLRAAFYADIEQITYHLEAVAELPKYAPLLAKFPEIGMVIKSIRIVHDLEDGTSNAAGLIDSLASDSFISPKSTGVVLPNIRSLLKLTAIISDGLRDTADNSNFNIWISGKEARLLVTDNTLATIYMGLIYQQINSKGLLFYSTVNGQVHTDSIAAIFKKQGSNILLFQNKISEFVSVASKVSSTLLNNHSKESLSNDDISNYVGESLDAVNDVFGIVQFFDPRFDASHILAIPKKANSVYKDIYTQQYGQAISDGLDIFADVDTLIINNADLKSTRQAAATSAISAVGEVKDGIENLIAGKSVSNSILDQIESGPAINNPNIAKLAGCARLTNLSEFIQEVRPYALFIASVVEAKTPGDVETAINNAILPVGSYTVKQNSYFNISLNAYLGYAFDINYAKGLYAPIGLSISGDIKHVIFNNLPVTAFFSVIDLGSVVSYQLSNPTVTGVTSNNGTPTTSNTVNTTSLNPQIKLGSLFSPSAELLFEWHGFPLAFGGGWRRTPTLYYSSGSAYSTVGARNVWIATVLIDIPFFTFHNNPRNQK